MERPTGDLKLGQPVFLDQLSTVQIKYIGRYMGLISFIYLLFFKIFVKGCLLAYVYLNK